MISGSIDASWHEFDQSLSVRRMMMINPADEADLLNLVYEAKGDFSIFG